jgi:hypothetical protein
LRQAYDYWQVQKIFYADNGRIGGEDATEVQEVQDVIDNLFERVSLFVNTSKMVTMTNSLASTSHFQSKLCRNLTDKRQAAKQAAFQKEEQQWSPFKHKGMALTKVTHLGRTLMAANDNTLPVHKERREGQVEMGGDAADFGLKTHFAKDFPSFLQSRGNECRPIWH